MISDYLLDSERVIKTTRKEENKQKCMVNKLKTMKKISKITPAYFAVFLLNIRNLQPEKPCSRLKIALILQKRKKTMKYCKITILFMLLFKCIPASSQDKGNAVKTDYKQTPAWIKMMDDPQVNYFEAVKAFELYWEGKTEPEEESELINEGHINTAQADSLRIARAEWTQVQRNEYELLKYQFKRFKDWKRSVFPFVQSDGRILSEQERLEIWQKQQSKPENR